MFKTYRSQCPLCGERTDIVFQEAIGEFDILFCRICDLEFSWPMRAASGDWYESMYDFLHWAGRDYILLGWRHFKFFEDLPARGGKLLDIGCGNGDFLVSARERGYDVHGIDFDRRAIEIGSKRFGLSNLYSGTLQDFIQDNTSCQFDVITFFEVLEHLEEPLKFFYYIKKILKIGGFIAFSVPNRKRWIKNSVWFDYPPHHLTRWSQESIKKFLERNNFEIVRIKTDSEVGFEYFLQNSIRLGIVRRILRAQRAREGDIHSNGKSEKELILRRAYQLLRVKYMGFRIIALPFNFFLKSIGAPGVDIYVLAKYRG